MKKLLTCSPKYLAMGPRVGWVLSNKNMGLHSYG